MMPIHLWKLFYRKFEKESKNGMLLVEEREEKSYTVYELHSISNSSLKEWNKKSIQINVIFSL